MIRVKEMLNYLMSLDNIDLEEEFNSYRDIYKFLVSEDLEDSEKSELISNISYRLCKRGVGDIALRLNIIEIKETVQNIPDKGLEAKLMSLKDKLISLYGGDKNEL